MPPPLLERLTQLRRRARRLLALQGLAALVGSVLLLAIVLGGADFLFRVEDPGLRVLAWLALWALALRIAWKRLVVPLSFPLSELLLAERVEDYYPALRGRLTSAVDFLEARGNGCIGGSAALAEAVIRDVEGRAAALPLSATLDLRPARRAGLGAAFLSLVALALVAADPTSAGLAVARLCNPWSSAAWPQRNHLVSASPRTRIGRGQNWEVEISDGRGVPLPPEVQVHYRMADLQGNFVEHLERLRPLGAKVVVRREAVTQSFSFRVTGGDDRSMSWTDVEVVDPPALAQLEIRVLPPAYTGLTPRVSGPQVRAWQGSEIRLEGRATKPLRRAHLQWEDGATQPAQVKGSELRIHIPRSAGNLEKSQTYWLELTDTDGCASGPVGRGEIHFVADTPPRVILESPPAAIVATPRATIPLGVRIRDDLAIRSVALRYRPLAADPRSSLRQSLFQGPLHPPAPSPESEIGVPSELMLTRSWSIASDSPAAGSEWVFEIEAIDYRGAVGRSEPRHLRVVGREEFLDRVATLQAAVVSELRRQLARQRQARHQAAALAGTVTRGGLGAGALDQLQALALRQRQIRRLVSPPEGVAQQVRSLREDLRNNGIASPAIENQLAAIAAELDRWEADLWPEIERALAQTLKAIPANGDANKDAEAALAAGLAGVVALQDRLLQAMETLLARWAPWDHLRRGQQEWGQLARDQHALADRTAESAAKALAAGEGSATSEAGAANRLAAEQLELALRGDELFSQLVQAAEAIRTQAPDAAAALAEAASLANRAGLSVRMRAARDSLEGRRFNEAVTTQQQVEQALQQIVDRLTGRSHQSAAEGKTASPGSLRLSHLGNLRERQAAVVRRIEEFDRRGNSSAIEIKGLADEQGALANEIQSLVGPAPPIAAPGPVPTEGLDALDRGLFGPARPLESRDAGLPSEPSDPLLPISPETRLRQILAAMQGAARRLAASDIGKETQALAERARSGLDRLLQEAASAASLAKPEGDGKASNSSVQPKAAASQTSGGEPGGQRPVGGTGSAAPRSQKLSPAEFHELMRGLWGELPEQQRQQLLRATPEEFVPEYEGLLEEYFRRLAGEKSTTSRPLQRP